MSELRSIAILGPGAVGGFLAALLARGGYSVFCVGSPRTVAAITARGITLESRTFQTFTVRPHAATALEIVPDALLITVKAPALAPALERIPDAFLAYAVVVPFLNGIEHMEFLHRRYGGRAVAGTIGKIEVTEVRPGLIRHTSPSAAIRLAADDPAFRPLLAGLRGAFESCGIPASVADREHEALWEKFARLAPFALATAAEGNSIGAILGDASLREELSAAVREASAVARAEGIAIDPEAVCAELAHLEPAQSTSLARDAAKGDAGELDAIGGAMLRAAARRHIACPTIKALVARVHRRLAAEGGRTKGAVHGG